MEFKFRAVDERPPICPNPPSSISYFTEHALRGPQVYQSSILYVSVRCSVNGREEKKIKPFNLIVICAVLNFRMFSCKSNCFSLIFVGCYFFSVCLLRKERKLSESHVLHCSGSVTEKPKLF